MNRFLTVYCASADYNRLLNSRMWCVDIIFLMFYHQIMRTTVDIDMDILQVVKALAKEEGITMGQALSRLARRGVARQENRPVRNGVPLFPEPENGRIVTLKLINQLRDEIDQ